MVQISVRWNWFHSSLNLFVPCEPCISLILEFTKFEDFLEKLSHEVSIMFHQNVFSLITIKTGSHHEKTQHGENNDTNTKARAMVPMSRPEQILGTNTRTRSEQYWQSKPEQWQHARPKQHLLPPKQYMQTKLKKTFVSKTRVMSVMLRPEKCWSHQGKINDSTVALRNNNSLALIMKPCGGCSLEARAIAWMSMPNQYH